MSNQTDLEKKIEEAANKAANAPRGADVPYHTQLKLVFIEGAHFGIKLGREEMLQEVLEYLSTIEHRWRDDIVPDECMTAYYKLESKFKGDMTKDELEKKRDELADKRHKIFPNDTPRIKEKLTEWKNEFLDGFDSCTALLQGEMDAKDAENKRLKKIVIHHAEANSQFFLQLQSANAKLDKAIKCLKAVKEDIEANATDTLWCHEGYAMTIVDRIEIYLEAMDASEGKVEND